MIKPTNDYEALLVALSLAIGAPTDKHYRRVMLMVDDLTDRMPIEDVKRAMEHIDGLLEEANA